MKKYRLDVQSVLFCAFTRKLYLFLSMLVHGDGDGKSEVSSEKKKQCYTSILSIFQSIKNAEDSVDKLKTKVGDEMLYAHNVYFFSYY